MVDNIKGSDYLINNTQVKRNNLESLLLQNKVKRENPYSGFSVEDQTDISSEAYKMLEKEEEITAYTQYLLNLIKGEEENPKVSLLAEQYQNGTYQMPSDEALAEAMLGNADVKDLLGL